MRALDGLDLVVPRGSIFGLVGPNGAGKTTAFGIVGGLIRADGGAVDVLEAGPFHPRRHRGRVTLLPQDCELNPHTPVRTLLVAFARLQGRSRAGAARDADRVLDEVGLADRARARVRQLSHGMRRRVAVAQAFLGDPELVLLDEPTSGLDPDLVVRIRDVLRSQAGRRTLVVSSHVLAELEATCDHVAFMDAGRCTGSGPLDRVTGRRAVVRISVTGDVPVDALARALPGVTVRVEPGVVVLEAPDGTEAAGVNARALPVLLGAGVAVHEVLRGRSLEQAWLSRERPDERS